MTAADLVLYVHAAFVAFVVGGLVAVALGALLHWQWIHNRRFRLAHLAAIVFVALEALAGIACPLTVWEDALRGGARPQGFIADWVARLLYWDLPAWVFIALYCAWAALTMAAWRWVPPATMKTGRRSAP